MNPFRIISISLSPNIEKDDIFLTFKLIFHPLQWKKGEAIEKLEKVFKDYLGVNYAISFNSGRSALMAILTSLELEKESEVLIQGFTCNALVNPIIWAGLKPVYVDCDKTTLNIDIEDLKRKLTPKSKVIIVQHTFGLPALLDEILEISKRNNLIVIEDCAHSLGAQYKREKIGTFGKAAFFSFGRDKIISSVYGGMATTNDEILARKIKNFQKKCDFPSYFWIFQQLLHPILINYLILPLYSIFEIGKWLLLFFQKIRILSKAVSDLEKKGKKPNYFPKKLPNALAVLALNQFKKLERIISHQRKIANFYDEKLRDFNFVLPPKNLERIYMRYSILIKEKDAEKVLKEARKIKIFLDDGWRKTPIVPPDTDQKAMGYILGNCQTAEEIAKTIVNLPTHLNISEKDTQKITNFLSQFST